MVRVENRSIVDDRLTTNDERARANAGAPNVWGMKSAGQSTNTNIHKDSRKAGRSVGKQDEGVRFAQ
ncbi:hypothetical protein WAI453_002066 [Rhynchosporium graminicola]